MSGAAVAMTVVACLLAGCGGSGSTHASSPTAGTKTKSKSKPATTAAPPTAAAPVTTAATTTVAPTTVPAAPTTTTFSHGVVGQIVSGVGATLVPPASPTTVAYNPSCQVLIDPGYTGQCVIVAAPSGTIAAIVETEGAPAGPASSRDLVYHRVGATWQLALRRIDTGSEARLEESDVQRDGDPKAVFTVPSANAQYADELDVVEGTGSVSLYRQLHGGFATVAASGGLETLTPSASPATGYDQAVISYTAGSWRITSDTQISATQAQALTPQDPFYDATGTMPTYYSSASPA